MHSTKSYVCLPILVIKLQPQINSDTWCIPTCTLYDNPKKDAHAYGLVLF